MEKFIVLNSGGFDSTVMAHRIREIYPEAEVFNLFFDYDQPSLTMESKCSYSTAQKLDFNFISQAIPPFHWTAHNFYVGSADDTYADGQYLEYRNLVFLSYAVSMAEAYGCSKIFMALFYIPDTFKDCGMGFIEKFNKLIAPSGIEVVTPFAWLSKEDMYKMALRFDLKNDGKDFFSCDCPVKHGDELVPCGVCLDCQALNEMYHTDNKKNGRSKNCIIVTDKNEVLD